MSSKTRKTEKEQVYQKVEDNASRCPQFSNYFLSSVSTNSEMMASNLPKKKKKKQHKGKPICTCIYMLCLDVQYWKFFKLIFFPFMRQNIVQE